MYFIFPYLVRSHNQSNCSSSYTPNSASSLFHHHSCCQTPILVKCSHLCSLCLWPNSSRWLEGTEPCCHAWALSGNTTVSLACASPHSPRPLSTPSLLQPPTFLSSKTHWCLSSHRINKRELSRIDFPPFFTTKIYKHIRIYASALYLLS